MGSANPNDLGGGQGATLSTTSFFPRFSRVEDSDHHQRQRRQPIKVTRVALNTRSVRVPDDDEAQFHGIVKTAWAVLLRCYTGQDQVCFSFSCDADGGNDATVAFDFGDAADNLSVADAVAGSAAGVSAKDSPGERSAFGRWGQSIPTFGEDVTVDTAVLVTSGRSASGLGCVPKLKVCALFFSLSFFCFRC